MILSIQSNVIYGHVGNAASLPMYHACGIAAEHLDTVRLAAHPGYGTSERDVTSADIMSALFLDYLSLPLDEPLQAVHTGYFVTKEQVTATADFIKKLKERTPDIAILVDPVFGDKGRIYVAEDVVEAITNELLPQASIITPNQFELSYLAGNEVRHAKDAEEALDKMAQKYDAMIIATGVLDADRVQDIAICGDVFYHHQAPALVSGVSGTGDAFSALFLASYLTGKSPKEALDTASSLTHHMVKNSKSPLTLNMASGLSKIAGRRD